MIIPGGEDRDVLTAVFCSCYIEEREPLRYESVHYGYNRGIICFEKKHAEG